MSIEESRRIRYENAAEKLEAGDDDDELDDNDADQAKLEAWERQRDSGLDD